MKVYNDEEYKKIRDAFRSEQYSLALELIQRYLLEYPNDVRGKYLYASILLAYNEHKNKKKAISIYKKVSNTDDEIKYSAMIKLGKIAYTESDYESAQHYFDVVLNNSEKSNVAAYVYLSKMESNKYNYDKALEVLDKYENQENPNILIARADIYISMGDLDKALQVLNKIKYNSILRYYNNINNTKRKEYICRAVIETHKNNYYKAKEYYEKVLRRGGKNKTYSKALMGLFSLELKFENYDSALICCATLKDTKVENNNRISFLKSDLYTAKKDYARARNTLYRIIPNDSKEEYEKLFALGNICMLQRNYADAEKYFHAIGKDNISLYIKANYYEAVAQFRQSKYKESINTINKENNNYEVENKKRLLLAANLNTNGEVSIKDYQYYGDLQLLNYSKERTIKHIDKTHGGSSYFKEDVDFNSLMADVKELISDEYLTEVDFLDRYDIPYDGLGYCDDVESDKLAVLVYPVTNDIITMFPISSGKRLLEGNIKLKSQITKFKEKYKKLM